MAVRIGRLSSTTGSPRCPLRQSGSACPAARARCICRFRCAQLPASLRLHRCHSRPGGRDCTCMIRANRTTIATPPKCTAVQVAQSRAGRELRAPIDLGCTPLAHSLADPLHWPLPCFVLTRKPHKPDRPGPSTKSMPMHARIDTSRSSRTKDHGHIVHEPRGRRAAFDESLHPQTLRQAETLTFRSPPAPSQLQRRD